MNISQRMSKSILAFTYTNHLFLIFSVLMLSWSCRWALHSLLSECDQWPVVWVWWPVCHRSPWDGGAERRGLCVVLSVSIWRPRNTKTMLTLFTWLLLTVFFIFYFWTLRAGKVVRSRWERGRRWWLWPIWRSPACCSFTSPENGWTSSTPLPNRAPSATTHFFVSTEVCVWNICEITFLSYHTEKTYTGFLKGELNWFYT